jgi:hypothetical protein
LAGGWEQGGPGGGRIGYDAAVVSIASRVDIHRAFVLLAVAAIGVAARRSAAPPSVPAGPAAATEFSVERAMAHVRRIASEPHPQGSAANARVRGYLVEQLTALGLETRVYAEHEYGRTLQNIAARLPGTGSGHAVLLAAHYDSVARGPGASDDTAGVAALLETLRAIRATNHPLRHDVCVLLSDGEELGLLGARAFFADPATADFRRPIAVVMNFEARGTAGPSMMFETASGNAAVLHHFAAASPRPLANSLSYDVYKLLRNDTDFTVFRAAGAQGLNFAFIGNSFWYHTADDAPDHLDPRSLYHHGLSALALTRHFAELPDADLAALNADRGADSVYFNLCPAVLVRYPKALAWPLTIAQVLLTGCLLVRSRRRLWSGEGVARAAGRLFFALVVVAAVTLAIGKALGSPRSPGAYDAQFGLIVAAGVGVTLCAALAFRRRSTVTDLAAVGLTLTTLLGLLVTARVPGGSFVTCWPAAFGSLALIAAAHARPASWPRTLLCLLAVFPALLIFVPLIELIFTAITLLFAPVLSVLVTLATWLVAAAVAPAWQRPVAAAGNPD